MRKSSTLSSLIVLLAIAFPSAAQDSGPQVRVITSGGFTAAFDILGPIFEQATGIEVVTEYGSSMGGGPESIPVRLRRGETFDLLIFNGSAFDGVAATDRIRPASRVELARSIVGMAVRSNAPKPDISSMEAFVEALLAALEEPMQTIRTKAVRSLEMIAAPQAAFHLQQLFEIGTTEDKREAGRVLEKLAALQGTS